MRRIILLILVVAAIAGAAWAGSFWWWNLRGIKPAVTKTPQKIAEVINTTQMPLTLPPGFSITVFAQDFERARDLEVDSQGTVLLSDPSAGIVYALPDRNNDGVADERRAVLTKLNAPHGLALDCSGDSCSLFVAETNVVKSYTYNPTTFSVTSPKTLTTLPTGGRHTTRSLALHPDGQRLLVSIGSACDTCVENDARRGTIQAVAKTGGELIPYATGLRNSVFLTRRPGTDEIWATDMGRDFLGDDLPPEDVNRIEEGKFYGWPFCYGDRVQDRVFDKSAAAAARCAESTPPQLSFQAHSAPLGLAFVPDDIGWPDDMIGNVLVSFHGSWNRTQPTGYKVARFADTKQSDFLSGWLTDNNNALGRPVDLLFSGSALYISDDKANVVYRVTYGGEAAS
jgi:glucose/arabinose dehydrogenase